MIQLLGLICLTGLAGTLLVGVGARVRVLALA